MKNYLFILLVFATISCYANCKVYKSRSDANRIAQMHLVKIVNKTTKDVIKIGDTKSFWGSLIPAGEIRYVWGLHFHYNITNIAMSNNDTPHFYIYKNGKRIAYNSSIKTLYIYETKAGRIIITNLPVEDLR